MPLGAPRPRLHELPSRKDSEIVCYCRISLRGYEAARVLEGRGWTNVEVMAGGIVAWPYPREKWRSARGLPIGDPWKTNATLPTASPRR